MSYDYQNNTNDSKWQNTFIRYYKILSKHDQSRSSIMWLFSTKYKFVVSESFATLKKLNTKQVTKHSIFYNNRF
jgi:hypothetical protein